PISSASNQLDLVFAGSGSMTIFSPLSTNGGNVQLDGGTVETLLSAAIDAGAGLVAINANPGGIGGNEFTLRISGPITTTSTAAGAVSLKVNAIIGGTGGASIIGNITAGTTGAGTITIDTANGGATGGSVT